jgi:choline-sulfatase
MTRPANLLFIISDEHAAGAIGAAGHPHIQTPHLDRLAAGGTRFTHAYTPSPICVPARACLASGRYLHQLHNWSSAEPYFGQPRGWGHQLLDLGHTVTSIGKLHFRSTEDENGFGQEILPMHVLEGTGWVKGLLRNDPPDYTQACRELAEQVGPGESSYTEYDRAIARESAAWLQRQTQAPDQKPWVLFVSFVCPHYPFIAPPEFMDRYDPANIDLPAQLGPPKHPALREMYRFYDYASYFDDARTREARAAYYGLCSFLDDNIGQVLAALDASGQREHTRVIYTSDHGELLGEHGMWTKMLMYEQSVGIPMIIDGPDIPAGQLVDTPVSLVDVHQTAIEGLGHTLSAEDMDLPGVSLLRTASGERPERAILSEFHDGGSPTGMFMIRLREWKYIYYPGFRPQLFNLAQDPAEIDDLATDPGSTAILAECEQALRGILDPEAVNARAFADQALKIAELGGREGILSLHDFGFTPTPG